MSNHDPLCPTLWSIRQTCQCHLIRQVREQEQEQAAQKADWSKE